MPFTLSHPAAVLPLARRLRPLSALVIGAMVPDLPYFLPDHLAVGAGSHSPAGLLLFCVPAGLVVFVVFHALLREPLVHLLPAAERRALGTPPPVACHFRNPVVVPALLLLGAISHVAWDSFTHRQGWAVANVSFFSTDLGGAMLGHLPLYQLLQHASSLAGAWALASSYRRWRRRLPASPWEPSPRRTMAGLLIVVPGALAALVALLTEGLSPVPKLDRALYHAVTSAMSYAGLGLVLYAVSFRLVGGTPGSVSVKVEPRSF